MCHHDFEHRALRVVDRERLLGYVGDALVAPARFYVRLRLGLLTRLDTLDLHTRERGDDGPELHESLGDRWFGYRSLKPAVKGRFRGGGEGDVQGVFCHAQKVARRLPGVKSSMLISAPQHPSES